MCTNNFDYNDVIWNSNDVEEAIKGLNCNKSWGVDDIYAEHLKYSSKRLNS